MDHLERNIAATDNKIIGNTQHAPPVLTQPPFTRTIERSLLLVIMCRPIDLDDELRRDTSEVDDIPPDRHLPSDFDADAAVPQSAPKDVFDRGLITA